MDAGRHEFTVVSSEILHEAPIMALRRDRVTMPGGGTATREIVEHFGAVAVVAVDEQDRLRMVRQYRHSVRDRLWELPAGLLDVAGEDPAAAAARELAEETGLAARRWNTLVDVISAPGFVEEAVRVFLARDLHEVDRPEPEEEEADMVAEWVPVADAVDMALRGELVNSIAVGGVLACAEALRGGWALRGGTGLRPADAPWPHRPTHLPQRRATALAGEDGAEAAGAVDLKVALPLEQANALNVMAPGTAAPSSAPSTAFER